MNGVGVQRIIAGPRLREEAIRAARDQYFRVKGGRQRQEYAVDRKEHGYTTRKEWLDEAAARLELLQELHELMLRDRK